MLIRRQKEKSARQSLREGFSNMRYDDVENAPEAWNVANSTLHESFITPKRANRTSMVEST